jgi:hypothetical protein
MATVGEAGKENGKTEAQDEDLWSAILNDVAASSSRNRPQLTKTLLVLGQCGDCMYLCNDDQLLQPQRRRSV